MDIGGIKQPQFAGQDAAVDDQLADVRRAADRGDERETSRQFETLFGSMLVRELRRSMPHGLFGEGAGADVYEGWFDEHIGAVLGQRDALGIAGMVKAALHRSAVAQQEKS